MTEEDINDIKKTHRKSRINWILLITFETFITSLSALLGYISNKPFVEYVYYTAAVYPYTSLAFGSSILSLKNATKSKKTLLRLILLIIITTLFLLVGNLIGFHLSGGHIETKIYCPEFIPSTTRYGVYTNNKD